jgi:enoyl-[acyl-carrier protein] reductase III
VVNDDKRVAVITGASRGIGRLLAQKLGAEGAHVVINYKNNAELAEQSLADVREAGGDGITVQADIEQDDGNDVLFAAVDEVYDHVDVFVANAAASAFKPIKDLKLHHLDRSYAMNVRSFVLGAQRAAARMHRGGRIVYMSSYGAVRAFPTYAALGAAKAMGEQYVRYMAVEYGPRNITVNAVSGGLIDTDSLDFFYHKVPGMAPIDSVIDKLPLQRPATAEDMANAARFLLSEDAGYITGQVLSVDGGLNAIAPPFWADTSAPLADAVGPLEDDVTEPADATDGTDGK